MTSDISAPAFLRSMRILFDAGLSTFTVGIILLSPSAAREGMRLKSLCRETGTSSANMTGVIDRLERLGFVERFFESHDRRGFAVRITAKGLELLKRAGLA